MIPIRNRLDPSPCFDRLEGLHACRLLAENNEFQECAPRAAHLARLDDVDRM